MKNRDENVEEAAQFQDAEDYLQNLFSCALSTAQHSVAINLARDLAAKDVDDDRQVAPANRLGQISRFWFDRPE
jgi:hypothetical protein